ncbi:transposase [Proteiniphilum sp. UBA5384]|uniref:transposase n=1 Tax=Proteiniphilum sp. UBA5384 TaxID=1947279 RepID=UPI0025D7FCB8|nr:transposase [Proteiniphilum sp. UBA5384]
MKTEKYQFRGQGSSERNFPTDGSLKKLYPSRVLHLYFEEGMDYRSISEILPVSFASVGYWIHNFAKEYKSNTEIMEAISNLDKSSLEQSGKEKDKVNTGSSKDTASLESELASLRDELKYQRLRADAYDEMINVAEDQFNIKIRKKVGAKR